MFSPLSPTEIMCTGGLARWIEKMTSDLCDAYEFYFEKEAAEFDPGEGCLLPGHPRLKLGRTMGIVSELLIISLGSRLTPAVKLHPLRLTPVLEEEVIDWLLLSLCLIGETIGITSAIGCLAN